MRRAAALLSLVFLACSTPCEELGNKFCSCFSGTTQDTCQSQVERQVEAANPDGAQEDYCQARLDECHAPAGATFCEWIETADGKIACGLAHPVEDEEAPPAAE
jgi:hypothetical protein